jgi:hypothetical protein
MAMVEDFTAFFQTSEFAVDATLAGLQVRAIFDAEYQLQDLASGIMSSAPVLTLASADVPANVVGASVVVSAVVYKVIETMPDGTGITIVRLRR